MHKLNEQPDWIDLNDWIALEHASLYAATKYLSDMHAQYLVWLKQWQISGCPDIAEPA